MDNRFSFNKQRRSDRPDTILKLKARFFSCIRSKKMPMFCIILWVVLAMLVGILTLYFTAPTPQKKCELKFKRTMISSLVSSSQPRSVALGDLNNDHQMDFVVANSGTDTIGIFISNGNGTFVNQNTSFTGPSSNPYSLAISDLNNDSYADIAVANYGTNSIGLFLGYGNGTFAHQEPMPLGSSRPVFVTTGDFNNDKQIDLAVVNNGTHTMGILFGYGNGSFHQQITYSTDYDSFPCSLAVGDFNNDTYLDIAVANSGTNTIGIFLNYGNGTFTDQQTYTTGLHSNSSSIAVGDMNNDNRLDVIVGNYGEGNVGIFYGYGNGSFLPQVTYMISSNAYPSYISVNDMNKDDHLDIVIVDSTNDQLHIILGHEEERSFTNITTYDATVGSVPVWIGVADFNNNNQLDVVVVNYGTNNVAVLTDYFIKPSVRQTNYHGGDLGELGSVAVSDFNDDGIFDIVFNPGIYIAILMGLGNNRFDQQRTHLIDDESVTQYVCTGDLNNDDQIDIIIADIGLDGIDVFLGHGNGTFANMTSYSTGIGSAPWWIALGDLNDDNRTDMVSANTGTHSIGILLGDGNGNFTLTMNYFVEFPRSVAVGDINNDKRLDIVVSTGTGKVVIYLRQSSNTFINIGTYVSGYDYTSFSISLADFNKDNCLDVTVTNTFKDNIGVLLGYGNGTFTSQITYSTGDGSQPYYVIVADLNNDNISDLIGSNLGNDEVIIYYGYGNGTFGLPRKYSTGYGSKPYSIATADLDNDTHLELVVALAGTGDIAVLTEYNAAGFLNKTVYSTGSASHATSISTGDFNNDNRSDIVVTNAGKDSLSVLLASSNDTFDIEIIYRIGTDFYPHRVLTCDINKDHQLDMVSVNSKMNSISLIMGYGNGSFAEQKIYSTGDKSNPYGVVAGDVNNDNRLDLVVANKGTNSIGILYGFDYTSFISQQTYPNAERLTPRGIIARDFNNDDILDIAVTFFDSDSWCIFFGYGNGSFTTPKTYSLPKGSSPWAIGVGDFNNDNQTDILVTNYRSHQIGVFLGYGNGSFGNVTLYSTRNGSRPIAAAFGDFNNDNRLDVVVANRFFNDISIFVGYGNGSFVTMMTYSTGQNSLPYAVTVADFNNDGRLDIVVVNYGTSNVGILFGYGNGTFATQVTFSLGYNSGPISISIGDFNRDHQLDIATANFDGNNVGVLLGYGNGSFAPVRTYSTGDGSLPRDINVGDFNNDNILDIAVANYGTNTVVVLFGIGDGSFLLGSAYSTDAGSLPWALAIGDFNRDGRLDIAVANVKASTVGIFLGNDTQPFAGVTTYPIVDGSQSHALALGHFNNDSWLDIAVANYGNHSVGILLGHSHGNFSDIRLYSTGDGSAPYSIAVAHLNNDTYLDIVVSNSETNNIVIFLGDGAGTFIFGATYSTGARSRPYTITIDDFNNDNISDVAVANSGTNNILLLHGYGDGTFGNDTFYPFGYEYQPYSIATRLNKNGWMDIVIACYGTDHIETLTKMC